MPTGKAVSIPTGKEERSARQRAETAHEWCCAPGAGVALYVVQRLLGDAIEDHLGPRVEPLLVALAGQAHLHAHTIGQLDGQSLECMGQAEVVENGRTQVPADPAQFSDRAVQGLSLIHI